MIYQQSKAGALRTAICVVLALCIVLGLMPAGLASEATRGNSNYLASSKESSVSIFVPMETKPGEFMAPSTKDFIITYPGYNNWSVDAYCMNFYAEWPQPNGTQGWTLHDEVNTTAEFSQFLGTPKYPSHQRFASNDEMKLAYGWIAWAGHPVDAMGIQDRYNLSNEEFKALTQAAVWFFSDSAISAYGNVPGTEYNHIDQMAIKRNGVWSTITDAPEQKMLDAFYELTLNGELPSKKIPPEVKAELNDIVFGVFTEKSGKYQNLFTSQWNPAPVRLAVSKLDENGNALSNAGFKLSKLNTPKIIIKDTAEYPDLSTDNQNAVKTWLSGSSPKEWILTRGKYRLEETSAPQGYATLPAVEFEIKIDGSIVYADGTPQNVKDAYKLERFADTFEGGNQIAGIVDPRTVYNEKISAKNHKDNVVQVNFSKTAINGTTELKGALLKVVEGENANGTVVQSWTSGAAQKVINLEKGKTYTMVETTAPNGFAVAESITFRITNNGTVEIKDAGGNFTPAQNSTVVMKDAPQNGFKDVKISKVGLGGTEVTGASIVVRNNAGFSTQWVSTTQEHSISLAPGTYTFHEEAAPAGYKVVSDFTFTVTEDGNITNVSAVTSGKAIASGNKLTVTDSVWPSENENDSDSPSLNTTVTANGKSASASASAKLEANEAGLVSVSDSIEYRNLMPNKAYTVTGTLYEVQNGTLGQAKSTMESTMFASATGNGTWVLNFGKVSGIESGKSYVVYEKAVSVEKLVDTDLNGTADISQSIKHENPNDPSQTFAVGMDPVTSNNVDIYFSKTDVNGTEELPGAKLKIVKGDNEYGTEEIAQWTSGTATKRVLLEKNATYTMVETTAPDGYEIAESITFMVDANGTLKIKGSDGTFSEKADKTVQMKDAPKTQPKVVKISKVNLGGTEIEGAEIDITGANGQSIPWTSSATPIEIILAPGTYTFKETAAPSGYQVVSTFTFTVDAGGNVSVNNAATTGFASVVNGVLVVKDNAYPGTVDGDSNSPQLGTTVTAGNSTANANTPAGITTAEAQAGVNVTDRIAYKNLIGGKVYSVTTKLYKVENGAITGNAIVTKTGDQTANGVGSGTWAVNLGSVSGLEPGASYVIYESAVSKENLVDTTGDSKPDAPQTVTHENPNDKSQTIVVENSVTPTEEPTPTPSEEPTPTPSEEPTPTPSEEPTPTPSEGPTPTPSEEPTPTPSEEPTPTPSEGPTPTPTPSEEPIPTPSEEPTPTPSEGPTPTPSEGPTPTPSEEPTPTPSEEPTPTPSEEPTPTPSEEPTPTPSEGPTPTPSEEPTPTPSEGPTPTPSEEPTPTPSEGPTPTPSEGPTPTPSEEPTPTPSEEPTPTPAPSTGPDLTGGGDIKTIAKANNSTASTTAPAFVFEQPVVMVSDTLAYTNLKGDKDYRVITELYLLQNGAVVGDPLAWTAQIVPTSGSGNGTWTIDLGGVSGLKAGRSYVIYERVESVDKLIDTTGDGIADAPQVVEHKNPNAISQTIVVDPEPNTSAGGSLITKASVNSHFASSNAPASISEEEADQGVSINDMISYKNLIGGAKYSIISSLFRVENGVVVGNPIVTAMSEKIADNSGQGAWRTGFSNIIGLEAGARYVIYERVESVEELIDTNNDGTPDAPHIVKHEDPTDNAQSITVVGGVAPAAPSMATTVSANNSTANANVPAGITAAEAQAGVDVTDSIAYKNLIGGKVYSVTTKLYKVANGAVVGEAKKVLTTEQTASASGSGTWIINLGKVSGLEPGASYVIYESAVSKENLVDTTGDGMPDAPQTVKHENPNDKSQTIVVLRPGAENPGSKKSYPQTGDNAPLAYSMLGLLLAAVGFIIFGKKRRHNN